MKPKYYLKPYSEVKETICLSEVLWEDLRKQNVKPVFCRIEEEVGKIFILKELYQNEILTWYVSESELTKKLPESERGPK